MIMDAKNQPNDQFGYSCYTFVLFASPSLIDLVAEVRHQAGMTRAAIPAHVTVKGTFFGIESLEQVKRLAKEIAASTAPFDISFEGAESVWWDGGGALGVPVNPPLQDLHDRLVQTISPLGTTAYRDDPYHAHMTYVQDVSAEGIETTKDLVRELDFGPGFTVEAVELMGRVGAAYGGEWTRIERYPLAASDL